MPTIATHGPLLVKQHGPSLLRLLPHGLTLLAAVLLTLSAYRWYLLVSNPSIPSDAPNNVTTVASPSDPLQGLLAANLFGAVDGDNSNAPSQPPFSSLKLIVNGVIAAAERGLALISSDGKPQELFAVGMEILPGVQLAEVQPDRIVLKRGNLFEKFMLEGATDTPLLSLLDYASQQSVNSLTGKAPKRNQTEMAISREMLLSKVQSPQELLSQVTLVKDSKAGFQLREVESGSLVEELGLRGGDVVVGINGLGINSTDDMMRAYQSVKSAALVRLEIVREGTKQTLQYKIN